jgi:hypothetical protein
MGLKGRPDVLLLRHVRYGLIRTDIHTRPAIDTFVFIDLRGGKAVLDHRIFRTHPYTWTRMVLGTSMGNYDRHFCPLRMR